MSLCFFVAPMRHTLAGSLTSCAPYMPNRLAADSVIDTTIFQRQRLKSFQLWLYVPGSLGDLLYHHSILSPCQNLAYLTLVLPNPDS